MSWRRDNTSELIAARVKIEFLEKENSELKAQVRNLQDALIASRSPEAYSHMLAQRANEEVKDDPGFEAMRQEMDTFKSHLSQIERPAFETPEDFIKYMRMDPEVEKGLEEKITGPPSPRKAVHEDNPEA